MNKKLNIKSYNDYFTNCDAHAVLLFCPVMDRDGEMRLLPIVFYHTYPIRCTLLAPIVYCAPPLFPSPYIPKRLVKPFVEDLEANFEAHMPYNITQYKVVLHGNHAHLLLKKSLQTNNEKIRFYNGSRIVYPAYDKFLRKFSWCTHSVWTIERYIVKYLTKFISTIQFHNLAAPVTMDSPLVKEVQRLEAERIKAQELKLREEKLKKLEQAQKKALWKSKKFQK